MIFCKSDIVVVWVVILDTHTRTNQSSNLTASANTVIPPNLELCPIAFLTLLKSEPSSPWLSSPSCFSLDNHSNPSNRNSTHTPPLYMWGRKNSRHLSTGKIPH